MSLLTAKESLGIALDVLIGKISEAIVEKRQQGKTRLILKDGLEVDFIDRDDIFLPQERPKSLAPFFKNFEDLGFEFTWPQERRFPAISWNEFDESDEEEEVIKLSV